MLKTLSFAAVHFTVAFTIGYLLTGSVLVGGTMALIEPACNTVAYHFHEKAWARYGARAGRPARGRLWSAPRWTSLLRHAH
ncbi:MAG TPA: DUF2061 domain-containing protein [Alphaproteobacteria bacterium]|nr:DUF2061 domain-containing protein [Alphaproteobacteria bacterium]